MIKLGTRASPLALKQAEMVKQQLKDFEVEIFPMTTKGDQLTDRSLMEIGGKGLFTKEIESALLENRIDLAVHSMKDVATVIPAGLVIPAVLEREDPRDAWLCPKGYSLSTLPAGAKVGTSSLRRTAQVKSIRPDVTIVPLRGNVQTRLKKLEDGQADATILALAGLKRLGIENIATEVLDIEQFLPAVAQGIIGLQCRENDAKILAVLNRLNHQATMEAAKAERALLAAVDGSCRTPVAAYATFDEKNCYLEGFLADENGDNIKRASGESLIKDAEKLGTELGRQLRS